MSKRRIEEFSTKRVTTWYALGLAILAGTVVGLAIISFLVAKFGQPIAAMFQTYWSGILAGFAIMSAFMIAVIATVQAQSERKCKPKEPKKVDFTPEEVVKRCGIIFGIGIVAIAVLIGISVAVARFAATIQTWLSTQWIAMVVTALIIFIAFVSIMFVIYNKMRIQQAEAEAETQAKAEKQKAITIIKQYCGQQKKEDKGEKEDNLEEAK